MTLARMHCLALVFGGLLLVLRPLAAAPDNDIAKGFTAPANEFDFVKREVMIPMRDGVKLYTVLLIPKSARNAPIVLTRTPYNASRRASRNNSTHMLAVVPLGDEVFVRG